MKDEDAKSVKYDRGKGVRALARRRIGQPPSAKVITPKRHKKPKHRKQIDEGQQE